MQPLHLLDSDSDPGSGQYHVTESGHLDSGVAHDSE